MRISDNIRCVINTRDTVSAECVVWTVIGHCDVVGWVKDRCYGKVIRQGVRHDILVP
jgi:hypothetical protein